MRFLVVRSVRSISQSFFCKSPNSLRSRSQPDLLPLPRQVSLLPLIPDSGLRVTTGCMVAFTTCIAFYHMRPFAKESTNTIGSLAGCVVWLSYVSREVIGRYGDETTYDSQFPRSTRHN